MIKKQEEFNKFNQELNVKLKEFIKLKKDLDVKIEEEEFYIMEQFQY